MRFCRSLIIGIVLIAGAGAGHAQSAEDERRLLRERIEQAYDVVPLSDGLALRPKRRDRDVRLIEISDGTIAINGVTVTGRELRQKIGEYAAILKLSYLSSAEQHEMFATAGGAAASPDVPPLERVDPPSRAEPAQRAQPPARLRRSGGDRIRIFGDVVVPRDEEIGGQVVAVFGSVRIDGTVGDQVVAVLGSIDLGPAAVVRGDVVTVGGRVRRAPGAQTHQGVTEVSLADSGFRRRHLTPWLQGWDPFMWSGNFGAFPRLIGSGFRGCLLVLVAGIALLVARRSVEASAQRVTDNPVKTTLVGLVAQVMILPVLVLTVIVLSISIIGIPLLLLLPFVVVFLIVMAVVGFAGTAAAIGSGMRRRYALGPSAPFLSIALGILVILSPLLIGRLLAVAGWPAAPFAVLLVGTGFAVELLAWACGFGAVLTNAFTRWQARRAGGQLLTPNA